MSEFTVGDRVGYNSEAGRVFGRIAKKHSKDVGYQGHPTLPALGSAVRDQE